MKIIFLDVDGVLNNRHTKDRTPDGYIGIDDKNLNLLVHLISNTDAKIVLSSDWRLACNWEEGYLYLEDKLAKKGITIFDKTIDSGCYQARGFEIDDYLKNHDSIDNFVILDDRYFPDFTLSSFNLLYHFVRTNAEDGFTLSNYNEAIRILNSLQ